jgi:hypothetical protein
MPHASFSTRPIEEIRFTRHLRDHAERDRRVDDQLVCDAVVNGVCKPAGPGTAWFFGRSVAVLAAQSQNGQVTQVLTAYYA